MKQKIEAILTGVPHKVTPIGPLWQISVGEHAGARENGISLAHDLLARYQREVGEPAPAVTERIVYRDNPDLAAELAELRKREAARKAEDALMAGLEKLEKTHADLQERPVRAKRQEGDMFDTTMLQDLIRENEPHAEAQRRWQSDYNQLLNRLVDSRLPALSPTEREYQRRLQAALYMGRVGAIETL